MKNLNKTKSIFLLVGLACLTTFFITCKNPAKDLQVIANADFVSAGRFVYVTDASTGKANSAFTNAKITAVGPDAGWVYSVGGKKALQMNEEGIIQYAFRRGAVASVEKPLVFDLIVEIPGYRTEVIPIKAYSLSSQSENATVINLANLPKGLALFTGNATADGSGVITTETTFTVPVSTDKPFEATLVIPSGTKLLDEKGNAVTGAVTTSIIQTATTTVEAFKSYGKFMDIKFVNANGSPSNYVGMLPVGGLDIEIKSATASVKSFSQPINAKMELGDDVINANTGKPIKEGETLQVVSKNKGESTWNVEANTTIKKDGVTGKLYADFSINHLSTWNLATAYAACTTPPNVVTPVTVQQIVEFTPQIEDAGVAIEVELVSSISYRSLYNQDLDEIIRINVPRSPYSTYNQRLALFFKSDELAQIFENLPPGLFELLNMNIEVRTIDVIGNTFGKKATGNEVLEITLAGNLGNCSYTNTSSTSKTSPTVKGRIKGACTSGLTNFVILPTGTQIKYTSQANKNLPKTDTTWKSVTLSVGASETEDAGFNIASFTKAYFVAGSTYTFTTFYENKWYSYDYIVPAGGIPDVVTLVVNIPCSN